MGTGFDDNKVVTTIWTVQPVVLMLSAMRLSFYR
jgi:hypothetical protein